VLLFHTYLRLVNTLVYLFIYLGIWTISDHTTTKKIVYITLTWHGTRKMMR